MSRNKFAAITSSLLARKGEAAPWPHATPAWSPAFVAETPPVVAPDFHFVEHPAIAPQPRPVAREARTPPLPPDAVKRCTVRLTQREYERLGILAVKKNVTRQQLLQAALVETLAGMALACAPDCGCLNRCGGD